MSGDTGKMLFWTWPALLIGTVICVVIGAPRLGLALIGSAVAVPLLLIAFWPVDTGSDR